MYGMSAFDKENVHSGSQKLKPSKRMSDFWVGTKVGTSGKIGLDKTR